MCGRYALTTPADVLAQLLKATTGSLIVAGAERWPARYNIAPTQLAPVARELPDESGRRLDVLRWGLVPFWAEDPKIGGQMINARVETAATKPAFRESFARRRCLVPADGFFEWRKIGRRKQPYFIRRPGGEPLVFAGLWSRWRRDEQVIESYAILTTDAVGPVRDLHDRMPLMLPPEDYSAWLDPELAAPEIRAATPELDLRPVSPRVNTPANDDPGLLERIELEPEEDPPSMEQPTLF